MAEIVGCAPLVGELGPRLTQSPGPRPTSVPSDISNLDPTSHLATTDMGRELGVLSPPPFWGEMGPHLTHGLPPCNNNYLHAKFHLDPSNRLATIIPTSHTGQTSQLVFTARLRPQF